MTRNRDKLNYDPGKDKISPSDLVGGGQDLERARNQELVRSFEQYKEPDVGGLVQDVEAGQVAASSADLTPLTAETQRKNVSAVADSIMSNTQVPVDKLSVLRTLYSVYPDVDILALMESELNKQQRTYGAS